MGTHLANRPFATELFTGMSTPGGFFIPALGRQRINAHITTDGSLTGVRVYIESVSDPNIVLTAETHALGSFAEGATHLFGWEADFSRARPGVSRVSFIVETPTSRQRLVAKIFVLGIEPGIEPGTFHAICPEGTMEVRLDEVFGPSDECGCKGNKHPRHREDKPRSQMDFFRRVSDQILASTGAPNAAGCMPISLLSKARVVVRPAAPYAGTHGDLPFQDPSWKEVLSAIFWFITLIAILAAFAAANAVAIVGTAASGGAAAPSLAVVASCCNPVQAVALAVAGAAAVGAIITSTADFPDDPWWRGQEATAPGASERTVGEQLDLRITYPEPIIPGTRYRAGAQWKYVRHTLDGAGQAKTYTHEVDEIRENTHVLSRYEVEHPDVVHLYKKESFVVRGRFIDGHGEPMRGNQLFVQCFLEGTGPLEGRTHRFSMQDDGLDPDKRANDGTYSGIFRFGREDLGQWHVTVVAQDVSLAQPGMTPEEAATYVGSQLLTGQLTINTTGGDCPFTPDGDVRVI